MSSFLSSTVAEVRRSQAPSAIFTLSWIPGVRVSAFSILSLDLTLSIQMAQFDAVLTRARRPADLRRSLALAVVETGATPPVDIFPWLKSLPNFMSPWKQKALRVRQMELDVSPCLFAPSRRRLALVSSGG